MAATLSCTGVAALSSEWVGTVENSNRTLDLQTLAKALGGEVRNGQVLAPGPKHSREDRSLAVRPDGNGGFIVHSFAGDDVNTCKDYVRERVGLPAFKPNSAPRKSESEIEQALL